MKRRFRTQTACRIARIDRDRFNEAVAAGNYPCAPSVDRGATRVFNESELIALFYYGRLLENDWPPKLAGKLACQLSDFLQEAPQAEEAVIIIGSGFPQVMNGDELNFKPRELHGTGLVWQRLAIDVGNIRKKVCEQIEEEISVIGPDDEGNV